MSKGEWWRHACFYQIAPRSFQDGNGDGVGDIAGLRQRLDYLTWLGVDALWLCPVYPSSNLDFGYDISDFMDIGSEFGSLAEFDELIADLRARNIKLLLDFVPNHTSDQHVWFKESRLSKAAPRRDWYVWRDPGPDGGPPNNWLSRFGGSAWEFDSQTEQYFYHAFLKEQPDLNWRNPQLRAAMHDVLRFWLERGVDGFRIDASAVLVEDDLLRNDPPNPDAEKAPPPEKLKRIYSDNRPETLVYLRVIRKLVDEYPARVLLAEVQTATGELRRFFGEDEPVFQMPLNYTLLECDWCPADVGAAIETYLREVPDNAWPNWVIGSHDKSRVASKRGRTQARVAALLLFTLPGTPVFYAGDEIGMPNVPVPPERANDPFEKLVPGYRLGRDSHRTPMRWDHSPNCGFTNGEPWLPVGPADYPVVCDQKDDPRSLLSLYRELILFQKNCPLFTPRHYRPRCEQGTIFLFDIETEEVSLTVAANLSGSAQKLRAEPGEFVLSTWLDRAGASGAEFLLRPDEGVIIRRRA